MPKYTITAPDGRNITLTGDSAPTEAELENVFANLSQAQSQEQPQVGMDPDTQEQFAQANQDLSELGMNINRGRNTGGALRNLIQGALPAMAETEAALRATKQAVRNIDPVVSAEKKTDETWNEAYDRYLENARESRAGYRSAEPSRALALQTLGGLASALTPFGRAVQGARLPLLARTGLTGAGLGAAFGFGNSQGGFENRLVDALTGAGVGAVGGVVAPIATNILGGTKNFASRFARGYAKDLTPEQIEPFMLSKTLAPTTESRALALKLGTASSSGAKDIENAAYDLWKLKNAMDTRINPASYGGKTAGGTTARDFLKATEVPTMTQAKKDFGEFVASTPTVENPTRPAQAILEKLDKNQTAVKILDENADKFLITSSDGIVSPMDPSQFEYWQKIQQILTNKLPKKYTPSRLTGRQKDIYDAIQEVSKVREKMFQGTKSINRQYSDAIADQMVANKQLNERLTTMSAQQKPESLSGGVVRMMEALTMPAYSRGLGREIIKKGAQVPAATPRAIQKGSSVTDAILRGLESFIQ